jgi:hypothetical protein
VPSLQDISMGMMKIKIQHLINIIIDTEGFKKLANAAFLKRGIFLS